MSATVEIKKGASFTEYRIAGSLDDVFEAIRATFSSHHPLGYGTMVHTITCEGENDYRARVSHSNSCD